MEQLFVICDLRSIRDLCFLMEVFKKKIILKSIINCLLPLNSKKIVYLKTYFQVNEDHESSQHLQAFNETTVGKTKTNWKTCKLKKKFKKWF